MMDKLEGQRYFWEKPEIIIDRSVNRLFPIETSFQFVLKNKRQGIAQKDETITRPKRIATDLAKLRIKYASDIN